MDNARIHHCVEIKDFIRSKDKLPVYTVPYTPELNPIENAFSVVKQNVRQEHPKTLSELERALHLSVQLITREKTYNMFKKSLGLTNDRIIR